jgi:hypothetical protein
MTPSDGAESGGAGSTRKSVSVGWIIVGAVLALVLLVLVGRYFYLQSKIHAELAAIRKAGFPVTAKEWSDYYPAPAGENAADVYEAAFSNYVKITHEDELPVVGRGTLPPRGERLPEDVKKAVSAYLLANANAIELLHKAATVEQCRFPLDFAKTYDMPLPHLAPMRQAARLLMLEALIKAEKDQPAEAAAAIAASTAAAHALRNEPVLISQLVRVAVNAISMNSLERVLSRIPLEDRQLRELSGAFAAEDIPEGMTRAMVGERCMGEDIFQNRMPNMGSNSGDTRTWYKLYTLVGLAAGDHLTYLKLMKQLVDVSAGPLKIMRVRPPEIASECEKAPKLYFITRMLVPALTRVYEEELKSLARLRATRAGIAVERFRLVNGRLPDSLDELVPKFLDAVPSDPFDDSPLRYRKLSKGFMTYGIGPDLTDHGGKERDPKHATAGYDITFIVAR